MDIFSLIAIWDLANKTHVFSWDITQGIWLLRNDNEEAENIFVVFSPKLSR